MSRRAGQENDDKVLNLVTEARPSQPNKSRVDPGSRVLRTTNPYDLSCCADADSKRTHMVSREFIAGCRCG
ncbi:hypothetical protein PSEUDO8O_50251 [Pseudomonas sp. 8O]|nr:hypothetical protein PSEUDO8O_50251 [Pseudomonas sp. 8O]